MKGLMADGERFTNVKLMDVRLTRNCFDLPDVIHFKRKTWSYCTPDAHMITQATAVDITFDLGGNQERNFGNRLLIRITWNYHEAVQK